MAEDTFLHQLMTLPTVSEARLSPDKHWVAFTWYRKHEKMVVFHVPADGSQPPVPLTHTPEFTEFVSWPPDSKAVIVSEGHNGEKFACLFCYGANYDITAGKVIEQTWIFRPDLHPYREEMMGGRPDQVPQRYHEQSPIHYMQDITGKLLIVQGAIDPHVSPENVRQVRDALEEHVIPYTLQVFKNEGHGVGKPANQEQLYPQLADFFEQAFGE